MIVYFSGTGNTRHVAEMLARELDNDCIHALSPLELREPKTLELKTDGKPVVWAFPTYSWGVPPVIVNLLNSINIDNELKTVKHIMVTTCGDDMAFADRQFRETLNLRGLQCGGVYAIQMPNNYVAMTGFDVDSKDVEAEKLVQCPEAVASVAQAIKDGGEDILIRKSFSWIKSKIIYPWFVKHAMSSKPFHATAGCTGCGTCARQCPMANIGMANRRPQWGDACAMCLRCYHICPNHALAYGDSTKKKGQYILK